MTMSAKFAGFFLKIGTKINCGVLEKAGISGCCLIFEHFNGTEQVKRYIGERRWYPIARVQRPKTTKKEVIPVSHLSGNDVAQIKNLLERQTVALEKIADILEAFYLESADTKDAPKTETELQDELRWEASFNNTQEQLITAARRAKQEIAEGKAEPMDLDRL